MGRGSGRDAGQRGRDSQPSGAQDGPLPPLSPSAGSGSGASGGEGQSQAEGAAAKVGAKAGKALGNKVVPGVGGKVGAVVGSKALPALVGMVPLMFVLFVFVLPALESVETGIEGFPGAGTSVDLPAGGPAGGEGGGSGDGVPFELHQDIPSEYVDAYLNASYRHDVPWPVLAAAGKAASDHGRYSPYDDACPQRDPVGNAARAQAALAAERSELEAAADAAAAAEGADGQEGADADAAAAGFRKELAEIDARIAELALDVELLGLSHRPCLIDRDPERVDVFPPGSELLPIPAWDFVPSGPDAGSRVAAPDRYSFDLLWGRWRRPALEGEDVSFPGPSSDAGHLGPMMVSRQFAADRQWDPSSVDSSVQKLARVMSGIVYSEELSDEFETWRQDGEAADIMWGQVSDIAQFATLASPVGTGCPYDPASPVEDMIEVIWGCELAQADLHVAYGVRRDDDGQVASFQVLRGSRAVDLLTQEALVVAAGFSNTGQAACSSSALYSGVFPLTREQADRAGVDRCDPAGNITAAARIVVELESVPAAARAAGAGPYAPLLGGWGAIGEAAGPSDVQETFSREGPLRGVLSSPSCLAAADAWAVGAVSDPEMPASAAWLSSLPTDAVAQTAAWEGARFSSGACPGISEYDAASLARQALSVQGGGLIYSPAVAGVDPALVDLRIELLTAAQQRLAGTGPQAAVWGSDSFVMRLAATPRKLPALDAAPAELERSGRQLSSLLIPIAVHYGGTVPADERAGQWQLAPGAAWAAPGQVLTPEQLERLFDAFERLRAASGDDVLPSAAELAEEAEAELVEAARFLSLYREASSGGDVDSWEDLSPALLADPVVSASGLVCPVDGARAGGYPGFTNDWQACRGENCSRRHEGNDIFAPMGTPIRAVEDGVVVSVRCRGCASLGQGWRGYSELGGVTVSYRTGSNGWVWYNAHLSALAPGVAPGARLSQGDVVGYVGISGNASGTPPHNHLGIFISGEPVNPFSVISAACGR